jgi:hypothetical protein
MKSKAVLVLRSHVKPELNFFYVGTWNKKDEKPKQKLIRDLLAKPNLLKKQQQMSQ